MNAQKEGVWWKFSQIATLDRAPEKEHSPKTLMILDGENPDEVWASFNKLASCCRSFPPDSAESAMSAKIKTTLITVAYRLSHLIMLPLCWVLSESGNIIFYSSSQMACRIFSCWRTSLWKVTSANDTRPIKFWISIQPGSPFFS